MPKYYEDTMLTSIPVLVRFKVHKNFNEVISIKTNQDDELTPHIDQKVLDAVIDDVNSYVANESVMPYAQRTRT